MPGHFDAVGFGEEHAEELLCEVGVDAGFDGLLPARHHHIAHTVGLDDRRGRRLFHRGHLAAHRQSLGDDVDECSVELIDARSQVRKIGYCHSGMVGRFGGRVVGHRPARYPLKGGRGQSRVPRCDTCQRSTTRSSTESSRRPPRPRIAMANTAAHSASPSL